MYSQEKKVVVQRFTFNAINSDTDVDHHNNHTYAVQCYQSCVISLEDDDDSHQLHSIYHSSINKNMNQNEYQVVTLHWPLISLKVLSCLLSTVVDYIDSLRYV